MSAAINWKGLFGLCQKSFCRSVYSGPVSTKDFSNKFADDGSWEAKRLSGIRQRVIDIGKGVKFEGTDKLIHDDMKKLIDLPHSMFVDDTDECDNGREPENEKPKQSNIDPDFAKPEVQEILKQLGGRDHEKVFRKVPGLNTEMPRIRLLTNEQLKQQHSIVNKKADNMLEIPPVMVERDPIDELLTTDDRLDGYEHCNIVFTDISEDLRENDRFIVVRETDGKLRKATWAERDRMLQIYFAKAGRSGFTPLMFKDLRIPLENKLHENILEQMLVEFNVDSKEYIDAAAQVYDDLNQSNLFDLLRSTRFFGIMTFYLAKHRTIDNILIYLIHKKQLSEASLVVELYSIIHSNSKTTKKLKNDMEDVEKIKVFISNNSKDVKSLQLALETYDSVVTEPIAEAVS